MLDSWSCDAITMHVVKGVCGSGVGACEEQTESSLSAAAAAALAATEKSAAHVCMVANSQHRVPVHQDSSEGLLCATAGCYLQQCLDSAACMTHSNECICLALRTGQDLQLNLAQSHLQIAGHQTWPSTCMW